MTKKSDQDLLSSRVDRQRLLGHEQLTHKLMYFHTRWLLLCLGLLACPGVQLEHPGSPMSGRKGVGPCLGCLPGLPLVLALPFTKHIRQPFLVLESHFILN